ncbi:RNB-domain-containing protein [Meredithblackwellia eburnea MCA 4105]
MLAGRGARSCIPNCYSSATTSASITTTTTRSKPRSTKERRVVCTHRKEAVKLEKRVLLSAIFGQLPKEIEYENESERWENSWARHGFKFKRTPSPKSIPIPLNRSIWKRRPEAWKAGSDGGGWELGSRSKWKEPVEGSSSTKAERPASRLRQVVAGGTLFKSRQYSTARAAAPLESEELEGEREDVEDYLTEDDKASRKIGRKPRIRPQPFTAKDVTVGSFIEVRHSGHATVGIHVGHASAENYTVTAGRRMSDSIQMLRSDGTLSWIGEQDITYFHPNIVHPSHALSVKDLSIANDSPRFRVAVQTLRKVLTSVDMWRSRLIQAGAWDYYDAISKVNNRETISPHWLLTALLPVMDPSVAGDPNQSKLTELIARDYAAHSILMDSPQHYIADPINLRFSRSFKVRSIDTSQRNALVEQWVEQWVKERERRETSSQRSVDRDKEGRWPIEDFAQKAAALRQWGRENPPRGYLYGAGGEAESLQKIRPPRELDWSPEDLMILQFIKQRVDMSREIQVNPDKATTAMILRMVDQATAKLPYPLGAPVGKIDRETTLAFLSDVGAAAPWENWVTHEGHGVLRDWEIANSILLPQPSSSSSRPSDPMAGDPHDSVRHSFGSDLRVYAIDDTGARELDDALSIEPAPPSPSNGSQTWWVHAHVADPTAIISSPSHEIAKLAQDRQQTEYFPEKTWSMIPPAFLERHELSLGSNRETGALQNVLTISMRIDEDGQVLESTVRPSVVGDITMVTYGAVDRVLGSPEVPSKQLFSEVLPPYFDLAKLRGPPRVTDDAALETDTRAKEDMAQLYSLSVALGKRRYRNKALATTMPRCSASVSPTLSHHHHTSPHSVFYSSSPLVTLSLPSPLMDMPPAQILVSEMMIAANRAASRFCVERGLPGPFRASAPPTINGDIDKLYASRDPVTSVVSLKSTIAADIHWSATVTSPEAKPYQTMGIDDDFGYIRATSPLRRYSDMLVHWQIKNELLPSHLKTSTSSGPLFSRRSMVRSIEQIDDVAKRRGRLSRHANDFWAMYLIQSKLERMGREEDKQALEVLSTLTGVALRSPEHSDFDGRWSQPLLITQLGLKATLFSDQLSDGLQRGEVADVRIKDILLSNRSKMVVERKRS